MTDRLKVLSVRNLVSLGFGGPDTTLIGWYEKIDRSRFDVRVVCFDNPGDPTRELREPLERIGVPFDVIPWGRRKRLLAAVRELVRIIRRENVQLLHSHDFRSDVVAYLASRWTGTPIIGTVYVWFASHTVSKVRYHEKLDRMVLRRFDRVSAVSEATRQQTIDFGFPPDSVITTLSGIDVHKFTGAVDEHAVRRSLGVADDDLLCGFVARLWPEKAHDVLLEAFSRIHQRHPKLRIVIVGYGPLLEPLRAQARELGIEHSVIFSGQRKDVPDLLRVFSFLSHASLAEGIALAIYEGMGAGLPVIASNVDGSPEVVHHEETGLLVPPKDVDALAQALERMAGDPELVARLGAGARRLIETRYSIESAVKTLESLYLDVAAARPDR